MNPSRFPVKYDINRFVGDFDFKIVHLPPAPFAPFAIYRKTEARLNDLDLSINRNFVLLLSIIFIAK
ncbi:hypothetical protein FGO68_gene7726 [Halteria grandinella]|uniref:Uncharacterized protein n=1 Tax=Halteria grandinella TaxID=5974 RepID=A0A8J8SUW5_HALGN|nr:hypothetical protein FGO68_gene7726 [Halteria grandinella]